MAELHIKTAKELYDFQSGKYGWGEANDPLYVYLDNDIDMNDLCDAQGHPKYFPSDTTEKTYCYFNGGGFTVKNIYFFNTSASFILINRYKEYSNVVFKDILIVSSEPYLIRWSVYDTWSEYRIHDVFFYGGVYSTGNAELLCGISGLNYNSGLALIGPNIIFTGILYASVSCAFLSQRSTAYNGYYGEVNFQQCGFVGRMVAGGNCIFLWRRSSGGAGYANYCFCILRSATNFCISWNDATGNTAQFKNFYLVAYDIKSKTIRQNVNNIGAVTYSCYDSTKLEQAGITFDSNLFISETTEHMKDPIYMADTYGYPS